MISKREKNRLKKILGNHYTQAVLEELDKKQILNQNLQPHSKNFIRMVFNGLKEHQEIEQAIYAAAQTIIIKTKEEKAKRNQILKSA